MEIIIMGEMGSGKSRLGDIIKNAIFKADKDCSIKIDDPSRECKILGSGKNIYTIRTSQILPSGLEPDIVIEVKNLNFVKQLNKIEKGE